MKKNTSRILIGFCAAAIGTAAPAYALDKADTKWTWAGWGGGGYF